MIKPQKFHLIYQITPQQEGLLAEEVPDDHGACDACVFMSGVYPPDGSLSVHTFSIDGRAPGRTAMSSAEMWKYWWLLAGMLSKDKTLAPHKRELSGMVVEVIRSALLGKKDPASPKPREPK
jgi:hypothetical protein